jgi:4-hydroxybenzoate polyprenyltransferase
MLEALQAFSSVLQGHFGVAFFFLFEAVSLTFNNYVDRN